MSKASNLAWSATDKHRLFQVWQPLLAAVIQTDEFPGKAVAHSLFCLQVCYYRDKNSINKFQTAIVTKSGVRISEPFTLETQWSYKVRFLLTQKIFSQLMP